MGSGLPIPPDPVECFSCLGRHNCRKSRTQFNPSSTTDIESQTALVAGTKCFRFCVSQNQLGVLKTQTSKTQTSDHRPRKRRPQKCRPQKCRLHADLENADLKNTDLENADLQNADLQNTDLENANKYREHGFFFKIGMVGR